MPRTYNDTNLQVVMSLKLPNSNGKLQHLSICDPLVTRLSRLTKHQGRVWFVIALVSFLLFHFNRLDSFRFKSDLIDFPWLIDWRVKCSTVSASICVVPLQVVLVFEDEWGRLGVKRERVVQGSVAGRQDLGVLPHRGLGSPQEHALGCFQGGTLKAKTTKIQLSLGRLTILASRAQSGLYVVTQVGCWRPLRSYQWLPVQGKVIGQRRLKGWPSRIIEEGLVWINDNNEIDLDESIVFER